MAVAPRRMKNLVDYGQAAGDPGTDVWVKEAGRGGPCAVAGNCDHAPEGAPRFEAKDNEYYRKQFNSRFKAPPFEEPAEEEEGAEGDEAGEEVVLGDRALAMDLDDYVPPEDAYAHNLLTSGAEGYDHFGRLPPRSAENRRILYGDIANELGANVDHEEDYHPASAGRGGGWNASAMSTLGDDQIGHQEDDEVPVSVSTPDIPGEDPDRFGHWPAASEQNQEMMNGRYWRVAARDGNMDRYVPADEAYLQQVGASHDRHLADALGDVHHYGLDGEGSYAAAREEVGGPNWNQTVFTGTDEVIEEHKGVASNNLTFPPTDTVPYGSSYLKQAPDGRRRTVLAASRAAAAPRPSAEAEAERHLPAASFVDLF